MQVFIVGSPLETAMALSKRHLNNQINEAKIILDALNGAKAWSNHPCVLQYKDHIEWLEHYHDCLMFYAKGCATGISAYFGQAQIASGYAEDCYKPQWHCDEYFTQMKKRLYTKDPEHYKQWADLGKSEENHYFVDGEWRKYVNGKRIE
ncbi:MAG: hypothetical protein II304_00090 [Bacteroidales bacterium]|nr:hypothetical protein [Bacteroidales bacterium]